MDEIKEFKPFGKLLKFIVDNRGKTCPTALSGIPLIATNCIKNENLYPVFEKVRYITEETFNNWFRGHPEPGDMIFVTKGTPGRVCLVSDPLNFCIAQDMVAIRADENKVYPKYLFAVLRSNVIQGEIENLHVGSLIPHFKKGDFNDLSIPLPNKELQEFIGNYYFNLSLKIDLLQRQNKTLEALAETLFRQWFVDHSTKLGKLGRFVEATFGGEWGKENPEGDYNLPSYCIRGTDIADLQKGLATRTPIRFIKEKKYKSIEMQNGDLVMEISGGSDGQSTGRTIFIDDDVKRLFDYPLVFSNFCRLVRPKKSEYGYYLLCYINMLYDQGDFFNLENGSSGIRNFDYKAFLYELDYEMHEPKSILAFNKEAQVFFNKINKNKFQIRTLTKLRDTLLPKLMSGEVRVG